MKTVNVLAENFKNALVNLINNSGLPIATIYYIYQNIGYDLEKTYYNTINIEMATQTEEQQQSLEDNNTKEQ